MANAEHPNILKEGAAAWNKWRKDTRLFNPDLIGADLSYVNLSGAKLSDAKLVLADLSGADLSDADLRDADLRHAKLSGADLRGADLRHADLGGANLSGTDLSGANLPLANLSDANLSDADLSGANLSDVNLRGANLSGANLSGVKLIDAYLENISFSEANLFRTTFAFTSLKTAKGLDTCKHTGPSALDYDTLMESGPLPEVFLRGCGFSDEFIRYLPSFRNSAIEFYSCFISYSHADTSFARRLHDALQGRGIRCWLDEHQILPGDKFHRAVDEGIRLWDKVLLCCSKDSLTSWWVDKEVEKALMKEEKLSKERGKEILAIIPLNLDGYMFKPDWQDWKQQHLTSRMAPDFTGWDKDNAKFEKQLEAVIQALRADPGARELPPNPRL
jgi:uncharacterized protein YjbI with pentapeptide repeats